MKDSKTGDLVYSTDTGSICPSCGHPIKQCSCQQGKNRQPDDGVVRISRQTKGRKGSGVCIVTGIPLGERDLKKLARQLKQRCGTGGTVKNGVIEIQGDHRETLIAVLLESGYKAKLAGG